MSFPEVVASAKTSRFVSAFASEKAQLFFKAAFVVLAMLSFNSFLANREFLSLLSYPLAIFGALVVLARLISFRDFRGMPIFPLLLLFMGSYVLSALASAEYGIVQSLQGFAWLTFEFLILFLHSTKENREHLYHELDVVSGIVVAYVLLCSTVSLVMGMVGYYDYIYFAVRTSNTFGVSFGRLWGVYSDPNLAAVLCLLSVLLAIWLLRRGKLNKVVLLLHVALQAGYIALSGSRTGLICSVVVAVVMGYLLVSIRGKSKEDGMRAVRFKAVLAGISGGIVIAACVLGLSFLLSKAAEIVQASPGYETPAPLFEGSPNVGVDDIVAWVEQNGAALVAWGLDDAAPDISNAVTEPESPSSASDGRETMGIMSRTDPDASRIHSTTGRPAIWASALEIFASSPLLGVSHRNIVEYSQANLPDTFISDTGFSAMHNILLDVLVAQGVVGGVIFIVMMISGLRQMLIFWRFCPIEPDLKALLLAAIISVAVSAMFYTEILYINSPSTIIFWIIFGIVCQLSRPSRTSTD